MRRPFSLLFALFLLCSCSTTVPRHDLPYPLTNDNFGDEVKTVTIPLPVIASSPNEGITGGALVAFLLYNKKDEASTLVVPQINYNDYFGVTSSIYGAFYPTPEREIQVSLAQATHINKEYRIRYGDEAFLNRRFELSGTLYDFADGSARFFGFQSNSARQNETNYADREAGGKIDFGYRLLPGNFELVFGERFKKVEIGHGAVNKVPFITDVFPAQSVPGADGFTVHAQQFSVVYSTLNARNLPVEGVYGRAMIDTSFRALGSSETYQRFELQFLHYLPLQDARFITVSRIAASQTNGSNIPFLEQSILGGETTLRGYGQNRFIDNSYLLLNLEERIRLFRWEIFHVQADWELAPFIDLGSVMKSLVKAKESSFEFNPGIGLRAVVRPNILGRVDIGVGKEGPAVFVGLGYPF
ncbi:BamA/TamA family outer membrane protein [Geomesophilobacter sediminis]|uniref:BamA/TamA family outer membrane protein n=1 Tax=Geomesophilobacter sediminis TaxID=2798584 RepID=A0A8J7JDA1_9BACT|nr:BamA/TamA family outer membrane protein [Geomesophilobacter sediminis]MBJ6725316.1 BamA/TamA family outer membrane protein [Geomesophilobacter sediminis]